IASPFLEGPRQAVLNITGGEVTVDEQPLEPGTAARFLSTYQLKQDGVWYDVREELRIYHMGSVTAKVQPHVC
ncbi:MAG: hypothetical protein LC624_12525, partial [Halobacteriales archaeon]|nr:hypothetical protein [Halobacteriales archaeon]